MLNHTNDDTIYRLMSLCQSYCIGCVKADISDWCIYIYPTLQTAKFATVKVPPKGTPQKPFSPHGWLVISFVTVWLFDQFDSVSTCGEAPAQIRVNVGPAGPTFTRIWVWSLASVGGVAMGGCGRVVRGCIALLWRTCIASYHYTSWSRVDTDRLQVVPHHHWRCLSTDGDQVDNSGSLSCSYCGRYITVVS